MIIVKPKTTSGFNLKILVLSDIHGNIEAVEKIVETINRIPGKVDLTIVAGDITHFGGLHEALNVLRTLNEAGAECLFFIPGNCDSPEIEKFESVEGIFNIHMKVLEHAGYRFLGLGGSSKTPFHTLYEFTEEEIEDMLEKLILKVPDTSRLVTVTHDPPYNTRIDINKRGVHVGSKRIREFVLNKKPFLHISGHIHEAKGVDRLDGTVLVNPGSASLGYYSFIEIIEGDVKVEFCNAFQ